jgi:hypothetical protein
MFEKIVLRRSEKGPVLSAGELAEALLFYQNVHIILDYPSLNGLISQVGMPKLLALLARPNVSAVYCEESLGTTTNRIGKNEYHSFVAFTFSGSQEVGQLSRKKRLEYILTKKGYDKHVARKLTERFRELVPIRKLSNDYFLPGGVVNAAADDILDTKFVHEAVRRVLSHTVGVPQLMGDYRFEILHAPTGFQIVTDVDFNAINEARKSRDLRLDDINPAHIVNEILMARADTALAAHYGGEFYTSDVTSQIVRLRYSELLKRAGIEAEELRQLKEVIVADSPSIREVIDSGERTFDEFIKLLEKSERFRAWIKSIHPDEKLVRAYLKDVTAEGWISKLPSKCIRYIFGALVGLAQPAAGLILSAGDALLLEKIMGGWRPTHFVEGKLKPFLGTDDNEDR